MSDNNHSGSVKLVQSDGSLEKDKKDQVERRNTDPMTNTSGETPPETYGRSVDYGEKDTDHEFHAVVMVVSFALAYPPPSKENARVLEELVKKGKKTLDAPKPCYYFHCEYTLIPETDPAIFDIVTYPVGAKIFTELDAKVVRTWNDGNMMWVTFQQEHEVLVTEELAHQLHGHQVTVHVTNGKDKVSQRAKNDKPKAFRIPGSSDSDSVKDVIGKISSTWLMSQPRGSKSEIIQPQATFDDEPYSPGHSPTNFRSSLGRLAGVGKSKVKSGTNNNKDQEFLKEDKKRVETLHHQADAIQKQLKNAHELNSKDNRNTSITIRSSTIADEPEKFGEINVVLRLETLFSGATQLTCRLNQAFGPMCDSFVNVVLDRPLLPKGLERKLNPMVLTISSVKNLPNTPIPRQRLVEECESVYCKYDFMNTGQVVTPSMEHQKNVYFNDVRVFFLGCYDYTELCEYIQDNRFQIHVHDRDQKPRPIDEENPPNLYGNELNDTEKSTQRSSVPGGNTSKKTATRSPTKRTDCDTTSGGVFDNLPNLNYFAYYGVAKVPLLDILHGSTNIYYEAAVASSESPEFSGKLMREMQREKQRILGSTAGSRRASVSPTKRRNSASVSASPAPLGQFDDVTIQSLKLSALNQRLASMPLPAGDYIGSETTVKVHIKLCQPLRPPTPQLTFDHDSSVAVQAKKEGFFRMVLYFSYTNKNLLHKLDKFITVENAKALSMSNFEYHVMEAALNTYKLTKEQKENASLDIITGFHIMDGEFHIFALEGLLSGAMGRLLSEVPREKQSAEEQLVELYNTEIKFVKRLYDELDVNLTSVRLYQSLSTIVQQPLLYIRDIIPKMCLQSILQLNQITQSIRFRDLLFSNLFPSCEMIMTLNRELGVAITFKDFEGHHDEKIKRENDEPVPEEKYNKPILKKRQSLDQKNPYYDRVMRERRSQDRSNSIDYASRNIEEVRKSSQNNAIRRRSEQKNYIRANVEGFNYSSQALNSTVISKELMKKHLKENHPDKKFTYSNEYTWATVSPPKTPESPRQNQRSNRIGFRFSKHVEPKPELSEARLAELRLPFRDNVLNNNMLESPLEWRETHEWNGKNEMKRYLKTDDYFSESQKRSIFSPANHSSPKNKKQAIEEWKNKMVVDDSRMHFHRVLPQTEKSQSSNQCDRMLSMLKDQPKKLSLKKYSVATLPPLYVHNNETSC